MYPANSTKRYSWLARSTSILLMKNDQIYIPSYKFAIMLKCLYCVPCMVYIFHLQLSAYPNFSAFYYATIVIITSLHLLHKFLRPSILQKGMTIVLMKSFDHVVFPLTIYHQYSRNHHIYHIPYCHIPSHLPHFLLQPSFIFSTFSLPHSVTFLTATFLCYVTDNMQQ